MAKIFIPVLNGYINFDIKTIVFDSGKLPGLFEPINIPF